MTPITSSTNKESCTPISSNCVIWQGPNLSCINLCKGDSVSDVIYRLAKELCEIQELADISDVNFTCLLNVCNTQSTLPAVPTLGLALQLLVDKVCCIDDIINNLPTPGEPYVEPTLNLPLCLQYVNNQGQTVTSLKLSEYVLTMATKLCAINTTVNTHTSQISVLQTQVANLIANSGNSNLPTVTPKCVLPAVPTAMNTVLTAVEDRLCSLINVLGTNPQIVAATGSICTGLSSAPAFSSNGTMSSISGWNASVSNLAQSIQNLWITVCDMRGILNSLVDCCGEADCSKFLLDYTVSTNNNRTTVTLVFSPGTTIPAGYTNCNPSGSVVTISDGVGHTYSGFVNLVTLSTNPGGITIDVGASNLDPAQVYTVTVNGCIKDGDKTCEKTTVKTSVPPCPIVTGVTATIT